MKKFSRRTKIIAVVVIGVLAVVGLFVSSFFTGPPDAVRAGTPIVVTVGDKDRRCVAAGTFVAADKTYAITAGHCGPDGSTVHEVTDGWRGKMPIGRIVYSSVYDAKGPQIDGDWALIEVTRSYGSDAGPQFHPYEISRSNPDRGSGACKIGLTTAITCGGIIDPDPNAAANVVYTDGSKTGMFPSVKLCAKPGDSGAPIIVNDKVVGVLSSIADDNAGCANKTIFYTPMSQVLDGAAKVLGAKPKILNTEGAN